MCAPIPLGAHLRRSGIHKNPRSRLFSARRALFIESRQIATLPPIPQIIPPNMAPQMETPTDLPVTTPPITALSPDRSVSIPGLSVNPGVQTFSIAPSAPTVVSTSPTYVLSSSLSIVTLLTSNLPSSQTIVSVLGSATFSSISASGVSSTYDTTSLVSTATITPVTTVTPVSQSSDSTITTTSYTSIQRTEIQSTETDSTQSFSLAPSSTATDSSSSIISSSTTNVTAPAVNTVTASPISVTPANLSVHNPSFYIGIVLGTVAAIACLCAMVAWFIRLRSHIRRRRAARFLKVPWAKSDEGDTWGLESGHSADSDIDIAVISAMNLGSREDLADVQAWSPHGDRDVGEPRRAQGRNNGSTYSLQNHPIPEHCLFSDDSVRAFASSDGYSTASLLPHHNLRQLPSHLIDQELVAQVGREHASLRSNENVDGINSPNCINRDYGTPRETMNKPRFLSLRGDGLNVPWHLNSGNSPRSMVERLRTHRKSLPAEPPWEQILPCRSLDDTDKKNVEAEPWSTTFKTSLVSAFNAVAANLSLPVGAPGMNGDGLTSAPSKRTARKSVRDTFWNDNTDNVKELSRETSFSTLTSKAWTLEETREGAGVVHLFIPSLQRCGNEPVIERPHLSGPILSFGDGDDFITDHGDDTDGRRVVDHPQVPLFASEKPPPAVIRSDPSRTRRNTRKIVDSSVSRTRSHYSSAFMNNIDPTFQLPPMASVRSGSSLSIPNPYYGDSSDSIVIEPSQISRLSSSDSSASSTTLDGSTRAIEAASRALEDRSRVLLGV